MVNSIFLDADIILDWLSVRKPHYNDSRTLFRTIDSGMVNAFTSTFICSHLYYFVSKTFDHDTAVNSVRNIMKLVFPLPVSNEVLHLALDSAFPDFEDAIQHFTALTNPKISAIITRNKESYKHSRLPVYNAGDYIDFLNNQK